MRKIEFYKFILFLWVMTLFSCTGGATADHWIDNPTNKDITITLDGNDIIIPANSGIYNTFEYGKHTLQYDNNSINFVVKPNDIKSFINPTLSNYVIYSQIYLNKEDDRASEDYLEWLYQQHLYENNIIVNDTLQTLMVPFNINNDLFIEKSDASWDYDLTKELPQGIVFTPPSVTRRNRSLVNDKNYQAGQFQTVEKKLFRENDFLEFLKEQYKSEDLNIKLPISNKKYSDIERIRIPSINLDSIICIEGRERIKEVLSDYDRLLTLNGADFEKLYTEKFLSLTFNQLHNACSDNYNGDYTFKQASIRLSDALPKRVHSFFVID